MRLNKFISDSGYCSRREADRYIEHGCVAINGRTATLGDKVQAGDSVQVNGEKIAGNSGGYVYIALNKPVGVTSTTDPSDRTNVVDFVNYPTRIFHIGRLDKDSEGLLLLTNDGEIVNKILRAGNDHEKEYEVWVNRPLDNDFAQRMSSGVKILGTTTKRCKVSVEGERKFRITLTQGLNRQIRRMCEALGYEVTRLKRVRIMNIHLSPLRLGEWRELEPRELEPLFKALKYSTGTEEASHGAGAGGRRSTPAAAQRSKSTSARPQSNSKSSKTNDTKSKRGNTPKPYGKTPANNTQHHTKRQSKGRNVR
ncbi:MAG: 23S rRNA pseudouridine(2604) synthase RluF [Rikenellaceae bacterium]